MLTHSNTPAKSFCTEASGTPCRSIVQLNNHRAVDLMTSLEHSFFSDCNLIMRYSVNNVFMFHVCYGGGWWPDSYIVVGHLQTPWRSRQLGAMCAVGSTHVPLLARFMGSTWGPSGADRTQMGPMLAPWTLLSGTCSGYGRRDFLATKHCTVTTIYATWEIFIIIFVLNDG